VNVQVVLTSAVGGLVAGVVLDVLTFLVARYGPAGEGGAPWSFRGNGALIVPFGLGPALIAGGWAALVLQHRGSPHWQSLGWAATAVGVVLALASAAAVVLLGRQGAALSTALTFAVLAWVLLAPVLAALVPVTRRHSNRPGLPQTVAALVLLPIAMFTGLSASAIVLPPGS
jgi:hypothetical protein